MYTVYKGHDNVFTILFEENDVAQDLSAVNKVELLYKGTTYDSDTDPNSFDYSTDGADGKIHFKLGIISGITVGKDSRSEIILYDPSNTNGIFWGYISLRVTELV
jgi:hypothetical protein